MAETPDGVRAVVRTARAFCVACPSPGLADLASPRDSIPTPPDEAARPAAALPDNVDPRQMSLFGCPCWTLATLTALAEEGVKLHHLVRGHGTQGVIDSAGGTALQRSLPSRPGLVFPRSTHVPAGRVRAERGRAAGALRRRPAEGRGPGGPAGGCITLLAASLRPGAARRLSSGFPS